MNKPAAYPQNLGFDINSAGLAAGGPGKYVGEENFGNAQRGSHTLPWGVPGEYLWSVDTQRLIMKKAGKPEPRAKEN
jgi:hypothetical protein